MNAIQIIGCGSYLPTEVMSNRDLAKKYKLDTSDEWIFTRTGIKERRIAAKDQSTSDLATHALASSLKDAKITAQELDAIILATTTPDLILPSTAVKVQSNLGANKAFAFDLQAVCSGFVYALSVAYSMMHTNKSIKNVAVIGAEIMSRIVDWKDRNTCVLFGDGAGAFILQKSHSHHQNHEKIIKKSGIIDFELNSDGNLQNILCTNGGISKGNLKAKLTMDGRKVFAYAVNQIVKLINIILEKNSITINEIDDLIMHQANARIAALISQKLNIPQNKMPMTIDRHANTSAASIPLVFDQCYKNKIIKPNQLLLLVGVGAGMTSGALLLRT